MTEQVSSCKAFLDDPDSGSFNKDDEVARLSSEIPYIRDRAFFGYHKLHTIYIPSSIETIGEEAFGKCTHLTSISLPASVRTIKQWSFYECESLINVKIPPSSSLTTIETGAFSCCYNLRSISLPASVTMIGEVAFSFNKNLTSVIIKPSPDLTEIKGKALEDHFQHKQKLISLPASLTTTIGRRAFKSCSQLQMIALPKHAIVAVNAFEGCSMLNRSNQQNVINCLKRRFDDLPLHQLCYNINDDITTMDKELSTMQISNQALETQDGLGMTPIHVLICNPCATPDIIRQIVSKNPNAAQVRNVIGKTPLHTYLEQIKSPKSVVEILIQSAVEYDIHDMICLGLDYKTMDVVLALNGRNIQAELDTRNKATGLCPFMSAAISTQCSLSDVYRMRKERTFQP